MMRWSSFKRDLLLFLSLFFPRKLVSSINYHTHESIRLHAVASDIREQACFVINPGVVESCFSKLISNRFDIEIGPGSDKFAKPSRLALPRLAWPDETRRFEMTEAFGIERTVWLIRQWMQAVGVTINLRERNRFANCKQDHDAIDWSFTACWLACLRSKSRLQVAIKRTLIERIARSLERSFVRFNQLRFSFLSIKTIFSALGNLWGSFIKSQRSISLTLS